MKITLISLDRELYCFSIRILSSCLKRAGHDVQLVFLIRPDAKNTANVYRSAYSDILLERLATICSDARLVGISLMSNQFIQAIHVTEGLKARGIEAPVIWGGIQPTVEPDECLRYADIVCIGEGEEALVELASKMECGHPYIGTKNLKLKTPNGKVANSLRPLIQDLNLVPYPDYSFRGHYIGVGDRIQELNRDKFISFQGERFKCNPNSIPYMTITSRGCPYNCSYCANSVLKRLYPGQRIMRWRSDENIIGELKEIQDKIARFSYVYFVDDNFTARSATKLSSFCKKYKKEIDVPFFAQVSPLTISEEKMEILFNNRCAHITMGVETAVERVAEMYNRGRAHRSLGAAIRVVEKFRHLQIPPPTYQFIIDNPYETLDEMLATLRLACSFPRPWNNPVYSLMLFPGVSLSERALKDGTITDKYAQIYMRNWRSQSNPYLQLWIKLYHANFHPFILKLMLIKWIAHMFSSKAAKIIFKMKFMLRLWGNPT
jgi:anaerobic magnesium-protoporphyrin IX monomethyl ester cyclase